MVEITWFVVTWLLLLIPAVFTFWRGRSVLRHKGAPTFEELHFQKARHTGLVMGVVVGVVLVNSPSWLLLKLGWVVGTLMIADYPYRKGLHGFSQGLVSYLSFNVRISLALHGHVIFLALIPAVAALGEEIAVARGTSGWALPAAAVMAVVALVAMHFTPWRIKTLVKTRPLMQGHLDSQFFGILQKARCRVPDIRHFGPVDGFYLNAHALPSFYRPLLLLSNDILSTLGPREVGAVFAHEVAHLEEASFRRRLLYEVCFLLLVGLAVGVVVGAALAAPIALQHAAWIWPMILVLGRSGLATSNQRQEHRSDLRGVELTGNPQVSIDALNKIHTFNYLPRRWTGDEAELSHPSLANRLRAIQEATASEDLPPPPPVLADIVLRDGVDRGTVVILGADRLHWLTGVSLEAGGDPRAAYDLARQRRTLTYPELIDLRIKVKWGNRPWLTARAADGERRLRLHPSDVARVKQRIDGIDSQLQGTAKERAPVASEDSAKTLLLRLDGLLVAILSLFSPLTASVAVAGLGVLVVPSRTALALAGTLAVASQVVSGILGEGIFALTDGLAVGGALLNAVCLLAMGMLFLNTAVRRFRLRVEEPQWAMVLPFVFLAPVAGFSALVGGLRWSLPSPKWHVYQWARDVPHIVPVLVAVAVSLALVRRGWSRPVATVSLLAACVLALLGTPWARQHFVDDPMAPRGNAFVIDSSAAALEPVRTLNLDTWSGRARWSPSAERLAVLSQGPGYGGDGDGYYDDYSDYYDDYSDSPDPSATDDAAEEGDAGGAASVDSSEGTPEPGALASQDAAAEVSDTADDSTGGSYAEASGNTFLVELGNGGHIPVVALDLAFLDDQRLLLLDVTAEGTWLHTYSLVPTTEAPVEVRLPLLQTPAFRWLPETRRWQVVGETYAEAPTLERYVGDLEGESELSLRLVLPDEEELAYPSWFMASDGAVLVTEDYGVSDLGWNDVMGGLLGFQGQRQWTFLAPEARGGDRLDLTTTVLGCECLTPPPTSRQVLCLLTDGRSTSVWAVDSESGEGQVLGHVDGESTAAVHLQDGLLLRLAGERFLWLDPFSGRGRKIHVAEGADGTGADADSQEVDDGLEGFFEQFIEERFEALWASSEMTAEGHRFALSGSASEGSTVRLFELQEAME